MLPLKYLLWSLYTNLYPIWGPNPGPLDWKSNALSTALMGDQVFCRTKARSKSPMLSLIVSLTRHMEVFFNPCIVLASAVHIQRRLAWPLRMRKDDTQNCEAFDIFCIALWHTSSWNRSIVWSQTLFQESSRKPLRSGIRIFLKLFLDS